ncbi:hypothetical protein CSIRO_3578 [Bradyrhizobiaceae bacterium SG-6C]|nr:hypothetical protein CSIRO_3578 [Bradyrhizobiaceae bacterium SG-6C]
MAVTVRTMPDFSAHDGIASAHMTGSCAGNRNMLSFAPHRPDYRMILTASQQKSHGRES